MEGSGVRQRRNFVERSADEDGVRYDEDEIQQPDKGWAMFFRLAILVFVVLPTMALIRIIVLVDSNISPEPFSLPQPPKLEGILETNDLLVYQGKRLYERKVLGPESIVYSRGHIYTGTADGKILHIHQSTGEIELLARLGRLPCGSPEAEHICGRPLGMRLDKDGYLIVLDAYLGIFKINVATRDVHKLLSATVKINGRPMKFLNDLDIASDGTIYFTDSGTFHRRNFAHGFLEGSATGRLLKYDPAQNKTETLLEKLYFANGVQLAKDESYVLVSETTKARITKYQLTGPQAGQSSVLIDNLPGHPDNIRRSSGGGYWVPLPFCRHADSFNALDIVSPYPWLRNQIAKIPSRYMTVFQPRCSMILELSGRGEVIRTLQDLGGERFQFVSEVEDVAGTLYLGSFMSPYIGEVDTRKQKPK